MKEEQKFYQTQAIMEKLNKELLENHNTIKLFNYLRNVKHDQFLGDLSDYVAEQTADLKQRLQQTQEELHACEFERIGNATTIKQLTTQLEKERKDKEAMGELLKEHYDLHRGLARVHTNTPLKDNHTNIAEAIKSVLTNSGITI